MIVTCKDLSEAVTDHREGRLGAADRAGWAIHLAWCSSCRAYVAQMGLVIDAAREVPCAPPADDDRAALRARFAERAKRS